MAALSATIAEVTGLFPGSRDIALRQIPLVKWDTVPDFPAVGRTSWTVLDQAVRTPDLSVPEINALKLKGVGLAMSDGNVVPPLEMLASPRRRHVGIDENGEARSIASGAAPLGGIFLDRAYAEFNNAYRLVTRKCPSIVPIAVYRYSSLVCKEEPARPLGAVLTGSPVRNATRAVALFRRWSYEPEFVNECRDAIRRVLGGGDTVLAIMRLAFEYGRTLRQFHEAGLYRYNSSPINYMVLPATGRVLLVDLDSSRSIDECGLRRQPLEVLRDVASAAFEFARMLLNPRPLMYVSLSEMHDYELLGQVFRGYFPESPTETWRLAGAALSDAFVRNGQLWTQVLDESRWGAETAAMRSSLVPELIVSLSEAYRASQLQKRYPMRGHPGF